MQKNWYFSGQKFGYSELDKIHFYYSLFVAPLFGLLIRNGRIDSFLIRDSCLPSAASKVVFFAPAGRSENAIYKFNPKE